MSYQQRLLSGLQALMLGLYEGAVGEPHALSKISVLRHCLWLLQQGLPAACSSAAMLCPSALEPRNSCIASTSICWRLMGTLRARLVPKRLAT